MGELLKLKNAPLVEVIAEVHWKLPQGVSGQVGVDTSWFRFAETMIEWAAANGLKHVEQLVPVGVTVPLDMLGHAPILRLRPALNSWPLVQLGQGLLTVNATPPYDGWDASVAPLLAKAVGATLQAHPSMSKSGVEKMELHYMDAFTSKHAVPNGMAYLRDELGLQPPLPDQWKDLEKSADEVLFAGEYQLKLKHPPGSRAVAKFSTGQINSVDAGLTPAALFDFVVTTQPNAELSPSQIREWFEGAHGISRDLFLGVVSKRVSKEIA